MDEFKIMSVDDFDLAFIQSQKEEINAAAAPVAPEKNDAPTQDVFSSSAPRNDSPSYFSQPATQENDVFASYNPRPMSDTTAIAYPQESEEEESKKPLSVGKMIGKVISVIMLVLTVLTFVFSCFICIFVDNRNISLGKVNISTMYGDSQSTNVKKGDLVVSKVSTPKKGDLVAVIKDDRCDLMKVEYADTIDITDSFVASSTTTGTIGEVKQSANLGTVTMRVPSVGMLAHFALNNIILVAGLFILLAALWILIIVLIDKSGSPKNRNDYDMY